MNKTYFKIHNVFILALILIFNSACNDEGLSSEAAIINSFSVIGKDNTFFRATINDDNTITIKVSPYLDAEEVLESAVPKFYLSKGATVSPDPTLPQNFAQEGGVTYTVTSEDKKTKRDIVVSWGVSDQLADGEGFSYAEIGAKKDFTQLGYPGEFNNFNLPDSKLYLYIPIESAGLKYMLFPSNCNVSTLLFTNCFSLPFVIFIEYSVLSFDELI